MKLYDKKFLIYGNCMKSFGQPGHFAMHMAKLAQQNCFGKCWFFLLENQNFAYIKNVFFCFFFEKWNIIIKLVENNCGEKNSVETDFVKTSSYVDALFTILRRQSIFGWLTLKFWRQYILILKGERAPKKGIFRSEFSKNCLETTFLACGAQNLVGMVFIRIWRAQRINLVNLKICRKIFKFLWKSAPLARENLRSAPG